MDPLLFHAPFGFLVARDDGHVERANQTLADMLGTTVEDIVHKHVDVLLSAPSRIFFQSHFFPILKLQGRIHEVYMALVTPHGDEVPVLLNAARRETPDGPRYDWAVVPMRTRNEYENEILKARRLAEEAAAAKDEFLSFLSHELRSPLSAILGWSSILARDSGDPEKLKRGLDIIERSARHQVKLVDEMLDHARLAGGKVRVELSPIDARAVLELVLEGVEPTAHAKGITIMRELEPGPLTIAGDADRLQQAFWNVLSNAVKFTPVDGRVTVTMHRSDEWLEIAFADTGKGIAPDFLPYVFESFRQEQGRTVRAEGGLGLGMSITRQLVELHGGSIAAASPGFGQGATFTVRLPVLAAASGSAGQEDARAARE